MLTVIITILVVFVATIVAVVLSVTLLPNCIYIPMQGVVALVVRLGSVEKVIEYKATEKSIWSRFKFIHFPMQNIYLYDIGKVNVVSYEGESGIKEVYTAASADGTIDDMTLESIDVTIWFKLPHNEEELTKLYLQGYHSKPNKTFDNINGFQKDFKEFIETVLRQFASSKTHVDLLDKSINSKFMEELKANEDDKNIVLRFGLELIRADIVRVNYPETYANAKYDKAIAQQQGEATRQRAEDEGKAAILKAKGDGEAALLKVEFEAQARQMIYKVINENPEAAKLEALRNANTIVVPANFMGGSQLPLNLFEKKKEERG